MAKFILGATEKIQRDDSVPVELLPSNKILYAAKLNNDEDADVTPQRCSNFKEVFEKFRPSFSVEMETADGEPLSGEFEIRAMKDFSSKELIEKNEHLQRTYYSKEMMDDLDKQLKKNKALMNILKDKEKKEALLKVMAYYVDLLSEE